MSDPLSNSFPARYRGTCADCDEEFRVGDPVEFEKGELVHTTCPESTLRQPPVCSFCWTTHVGECL